jgi:hypothetical protein
MALMREEIKIIMAVGVRGYEGRRENGIKLIMKK